MIDNQQLAETLKLLNKKAILEFNSGRFDEAIESFKQSNLLEQNLGLVKQHAQTLINIANIHYLKGSFNEALVSLEEAITEFNECNYKTGLYKGLELRAEIFVKQDKKAEALECLNQCLKIRVNDEKELNTFYRIAEIYFHLKDRNKAFDYINRAIKKYNNSKYNHIFIKCYLLRAELYAELNNKQAIRELSYCLNLVDNNHEMLNYINNRISKLNHLR